MAIAQNRGYVKQAKAAFCGNSSHFDYKMPAIDSVTIDRRVNKTKIELWYVSGYAQQFCEYAVGDPTGRVTMLAGYKPLLRKRSRIYTHI